MSAHAADSFGLQLALESETVKIMDWFKTNCMKSNPSKFQMLTFGLDTKSDFKICIDDTEINNDVCVKLVGGHIDNQLKFNKHILEICIKAGRQLIALKRLSQRLTTDSKLCIFRSFIFNHFNYCPIVWHFCSKYNTVTREKIQECGLRFVCNDYSSSYETLLSNAGLCTLELGRLRAITVEMFKAINGLCPNYISDFSLCIQGTIFTNP